MHDNSTHYQPPIDQEPAYDKCFRCGCTSYQVVCGICQYELEILAIKENAKSAKGASK